MIRTVFTLFILAAALSQTAVAAATQRSCPSSLPLNVTMNYGDDLNTNCQITAAGQIALFPFQGTAGDNITIAVRSSWGNGPCTDLYDPSNKLIKSVCWTNAYGGGYGFALTATGQYTIRLHDIGYTHTGTFGLMLDCWYPAVVTSPLTLGVASNGSTVQVETIDEWTFPGSSGEDITIQMQSSYGNGPCFTLVGPTGTPSTQVCGTNGYQARAEYVLPTTGTYIVVANSIGYSNAGTYTLLAQCLAACTAPNPVYPTINVTLTGCTTACANGDTFSATLTTTNFPSKVTELKLGFILPDGTTVPAGDPHTELPGQFTFSNQVLNGPIVAAMPRGSWSVCARLIDLAHGQTLAASCQPFTLQ